jgi:thioredoxin-like negative regulator of GroEL
VARTSAKGFDERLRQFEPVSVTVDGVEFTADRNEQQEFEQALGMFRSGKFPEAGQAFAAFLRQWPKSGYVPSVRFWLGNSQYATRDYKNAIANFRSVMTSAHACSCTRSGPVHRQLSGRTQGHQGSSQDPGRAAAGLSELGSRRDCQVQAGDT